MHIFLRFILYCACQCLFFEKEISFFPPKDRVKLLFFVKTNLDLIRPHIPNIIDSLSH